MSVDLLVQKIKEKGNPSVAGLDPNMFRSISEKKHMPNTDRI